MPDCFFVEDAYHLFRGILPATGGAFAERTLGTVGSAGRRLIAGRETGLS